MIQLIAFENLHKTEKKYLISEYLSILILIIFVISTHLFCLYLLKNLIINRIEIAVVAIFLVPFVLSFCLSILKYMLFDIVKYSLRIKTIEVNSNGVTVRYVSGYLDKYKWCDLRLVTGSKRSGRLIFSDNNYITFGCLDRENINIINEISNGKVQSVLRKSTF